MASPISPAGAARAVDTVAPGDVGELPTPGPFRLRVLGAFALTGGDGAPIPIASPRAQSLLAYLAL